MSRHKATTLFEAAATDMSDLFTALVFVASFLVTLVKLEIDADSLLLHPLGCHEGLLSRRISTRRSVVLVLLPVSF